MKLRYNLLQMYRDEINYRTSVAMAKMLNRQIPKEEHIAQRSFTATEILNHMCAPLSGFLIKESEALTCQLDLGPKRTHRKKRIANKWLKRYGRKVVIVPDENVYIVGEYVICHPDIARKLRKVILDNTPANNANTAEPKSAAR